MQSNPEYHARIHPALTSFADECVATLARLIAYIGALTLLGIVGLHLWDELPAAASVEPTVKPGWSVASRSRPAFAVSSFDSGDKSEVYEILRHPEGGRKDVFHWGSAGEKPVAELEIYRPGGEFSQTEALSSEALASGVLDAEIAARMDPQGGRELEAAGVLDSKFGTVTLLRLTGNLDRAKGCLGFAKRLGDPSFQISGWSCQGSGLAARRAVIGCMLNRLTLLAAGNEPKLAELFARAELRRGNCATSATPAASADWVMDAENPRLRGRL
ncbi:MAG TPA: hypothetical protein VGZ47_21760 [Gemmataceae bacterium]|jgi:hypothetical protein|nr:hypothetical protein [Gemmataceae bacterium]